MAEPVATAAAPLRIALVGNPNTGKTTLFNALTGLRQRVGNYPGVTVEIKTGKAHRAGRDFEITDVPGSYSLSPRSPDELLAVELLLGMRPGTPQPQAVLCVLDASNLERNLYLASQVLELGLPTVLALNMTDVAAARGVEFDVAELSKRFGVSVIPIQANAGKGLTELCAAAAIAIHSPPGSGPEFPPEFIKAVGELRDWLAKAGDGATPKYLLDRAI
ncbi:MAG TPA: FeoB small GTPase domain-containing protein, partial [Planctomycetia bacterium]|nr:FeoB small GTPase domain-containing protein [Planctomycetia bacterium]